MNDNKKIAINTVVLTIKLVITLFCGFVVSRLVLKALGADNYGLYNVVGGIVAMLNLVATSMVATSYRYMAVEIGKGESGNPQKIYSTLVFIHFLLAVFLVVVGLPVGWYYINNFLNITNASVADAHFVYVFSLLATFFSIIVVPSNGLLVAKEKFLPISIIEISRSLLNVCIAVILIGFIGNRLRLYAVLMAVLLIGNSIAFFVWCRIHYSSIVKYTFNKNRKDYKEISSFAGWILLGASAVIGRTQGVAVVINLFFKNSINAAFGVASYIGQAANMFTNTLRQSVTPQIMKNRESNTSRSLFLVYTISRYTFLIMLIICVPLVLCLNPILELWLGIDNVPPMTNMFAIFLLLGGMISNLGSGFDASIQAFGKIRKNQVGYTIINLSIIPIIYLLYRVGFPVYTNVIVGVVLTFITLIFQAGIMQEQTQFNYLEYWQKTIWPSLITTIISFVPMLCLKSIIDESSHVIWGFFVLSALWTSLVTIFVGINKQERSILLEYVKRKFFMYKS